MKLILSIEPAIRGGSIALFSETEEVGYHIGGGEVSRSEDLLASIFALMNAHGAQKEEIKQVIVSTGPGSFTGLRIGIATAMGLARAWDVPVGGIRLFEAIDRQVAITAQHIIAVPLGKNDVAWEIVGGDPSWPQAGSVNDFNTAIESMGDAIVICHHSLCTVAKGAGRRGLIRDLGENLAAVLARNVKMATGEIAPFYLSGSSFQKTSTAI